MFSDGSSEIFDGLGWSAGPAVPSDKLIRPAAVSIGDWEYLVIGGKGERGPYTTIVHHFSFRTGEWTVKVISGSSIKKFYNPSTR